MQKEIQLVLSPKEASTIQNNKVLVSKQLDISISGIKHIEVVRKSIDARKRDVKINVWLNVYINEEPKDLNPVVAYPDVSKAESAIVVGSGPAGLFAALKLIELGYKPIVIERGKTVSERKRDLAKINRESIVDPDSNYAFGEGGAGTFRTGNFILALKKEVVFKKS